MRQIRQVAVGRALAAGWQISLLNTVAVMEFLFLVQHWVWNQHLFSDLAFCSAVLPACTGQGPARITTVPGKKKKNQSRCRVQ
jgi:hypothetical protein